MDMGRNYLWGFMKLVIQIEKFSSFTETYGGLRLDIPEIYGFVLMLTE